MVRLAAGGLIVTLAVGPGGRIFALDRSGGRINVFKTTADPKKVEFVTAFPGFSLPLDIIILGRGGGSTEDLAAFNREEVADAIFRSTVPVVSAVGHKIDFSISDSVADLEATTPTNGADVCTQHWAQVWPRLNDLRERMATALVGRLDRARERLEELESRRAFRLPLERIREREQRLDELGQRLNGSGARVLTRQHERLSAYAGRLDALSPLNVLARGYSLTQTLDGKLLRDAAAVRIGDTLVSRLHRGRVESIATAINATEDVT